MKANVMAALRNLHSDESGQDLIEYALVAALITTFAVATMNTFAKSISSAFGVVGTRLNSGVASGAS